MLPVASVEFISLDVVLVPALPAAPVAALVRGETKRTARRSDSMRALVDMGLL
jgi:hypothetical protein